MTELTNVSVTTITSATAAALPNELVRLVEMQAADAALAADIAALEAADAANHAALTVPDTNDSIDLVLVAQALTAEVRLPAESESQAAAAGQTEAFSAPASGDEVSLAKQNVSGVIVTIAGPTTAALGTDYYLDSVAGKIIVLDGILVGVGFTVDYDAGQTLDGPAMERALTGLTNKIGTGHQQVARGDHGHTLLHNLATGVTGESVAVTVNGKGQQVAAAVVLAASSGLAIASGLKVDTSVIATKASVDSVVADVAVHETRLDNIEAGAETIAIGDTDSVNLTKTGSTVTADVVVGSGLVITPAVGVEVDFTVAAAKSVTDDHETRIDALEAGTVLPCPLPMIIPCSGDTEIFAAGTLVTFRMPGDVTLTSVRASLTGAATTGTVTVDVRVAGVSILTTLITIDATEKTSTTAAVAAVIGVQDINDDQEVTIVVTDDADGNGTGLKVYLIGVSR